MKIAVASDVHLEFGQLELENEGADVLILSGDICVEKYLRVNEQYEMQGDESVRFHHFFTRVCNKFPHVVYVLGNHEHYHGDFKFTLERLRNKFAYLKNLHILEKESIVIDDVVFFGGTLWTNMGKENESVLYAIRSFMNDFRIVKNSNKMVQYKVNKYSDDGKEIVGVEFHERPATFSPEDTVVEHKAYLEELKKVLDANRDAKVVVVGHHSPSKLSTHPRYADDTLTNCAYSSDLSELILDNPQIKLWTHGHTHETFDYMIGSTRIVCNPRGYHGYEETAINFKLKYIEL